MVARAAVIIAACALAVMGHPGPAAADPALDGPGRYYVFRTLDSGNDPTAEQNAACEGYFGSRASAAVIRLNAGLFGFRVDPLTGRLVDQAASVLGPGFICGAPVLGRDDVVEAYAYATLPGAGKGEATGTCGLQPAIGQPGALHFTCHLGLRPDDPTGVVGGLLSSNSIVNPGNLVPGSPTGSVWTAYIVRRSGAPAASAPPASAQKPPGDVPGADFYLTRAFDSQTPSAAPACGASTAAIRTATLRSVQPDPATGAIPDGARYVTVGSLTVCYAAAGGGRRSATVEVRLGPASDPLVISAQGDCRDQPSPAGADVNLQSCALTVPASLRDGVRGGMVTSSGLVPAGEPAGAANAAVWTISLFGGSVRPVPDPGADGATATVVSPARPRVTFTRGARSLRVRWRGSEGAKPLRYDVDVRYRPARGWRRVLRATARRSVTLRVRRSRAVDVRVRAHGADGARSAWATVHARGTRSR